MVKDNVRVIIGLVSKSKTSITAPTKTLTLTGISVKDMFGLIEDAVDERNEDIVANHFAGNFLEKYGNNDKGYRLARKDAKAKGLLIKR